MGPDTLRVLIRDLTAIAAPSGNEDRMVARVVGELRDRGLSPSVDRIGAVRVAFGPPAAAQPDQSLLIFAHLDELGLVVRAVEPDGFVRVHRLGGVPERVLPGTPLVVHTQAGDVPAVVGLKAHHLTGTDEKYVARPATELYLDLGASSAADVAELERARGRSDDLRAGVDDPGRQSIRHQEPGQPAGRRHPSGAHRRTVRAAPRTLDSGRDRVQRPGGIQRPRFTLDGGRRATGNRGLRRHHAGHRPTGPPRRRDDPAGWRSGGFAPVVPWPRHPRRARAAPRGPGRTGAAAHDAAVPLQYEAIVGLINDAAFLPMATAEGIATGSVAIPVRYTHSPIETAQLDDVVATVALLKAFIDLAPSLALERGEPQLRKGGLA